MVAVYFTMRIVLFCIFFTSFLVCLSRAQGVGHYCLEKASDQLGVCKKYEECISSVIRADQGIYPTFCGFETNKMGGKPIICCLDELYPNLVMPSKPGLMPPRPISPEAPIKPQPPIRPELPIRPEPPISSVPLTPEPPKPAAPKPTPPIPSPVIPELPKPEPPRPAVPNIDVSNPEVPKPVLENPQVPKPDIENETVPNPLLENPAVQKPEPETPAVTNRTPENPDSPKPGTAIKRISEIKCVEYYTKKSTFIHLIRNPAEITKTQSDCGSVQLIVGGEQAKLGEFPFMAAVGFDDEEIHCGGTLISERFVLTAAHCILTRYGFPKFVILGDLDLKSTSDLADPKKILVDRAIPHEGYKAPAKDHDIGLLNLAANAAFSKVIRPACLWTETKITEETATVTGWGITENGTKSDILLKASLKIRESSECDFPTTSITEKMICAGSGGGNDTCSGDSGGPLLVNKDNCAYKVVGVTSFGPPKCGDLPAVYTRVSEYVSWIEKQVWPEEKKS